MPRVTYGAYSASMTTVRTFLNDGAHYDAAHEEVLDDITEYERQWNKARYASHLGAADKSPATHEPPA